MKNRSDRTLVSVQNGAVSIHSGEAKVIGRDEQGQSGCCHPAVR